MLVRFTPPFIALSVLLLPAMLTAQQRWIEDSPPGGEVFDLALDPFDPDRLLVASGQLFVSRNQGEEWQARSASFLGGFESLAFAPSQRGLLYAVQDQFLMRSTDGGASFVPVAKAQNVRFGRLLAVDPADGQRLYLRIPQRQELLRSDDGGITFELIVPRSSIDLEGFALQPGNSQVLLALSDFTIFRSQDRGETWSVVLEESEEAFFQSVLFVDRQTAIAGGNGIWVSQDGGIEWVRQQQAPPGFVRAMAASASSPSNLYAATFEGVFISQDGALSWQPASNGLEVGSEVTELIVDPRDGAVVHAATQAAGVFTTRNSGQEWKLNSQGIGAESNQVIELPESGGLVAATEGGLFIRRREQARWQRSGGECNDELGQTCLDDRFGIQALAQGQMGLYAASGFGLFVSRDEGRSWQRIEDGFLVTGCLSLTAGDTADETVLFCIGGTNDRNLVKVRDDGVQFQIERINRAFLGQREVVVDRQNPDRVYVAALFSGMFGVRFGGLHISEDGGASWRLVDPSDRQGLTNVAVSSARVVVSVRRTVWTSDNGGFTFRSSALKSDQSNSIEDLAIDPRSPDTLYAATALEVFVSRDGGHSWTILSREPPPGLFRQLSFSRSEPPLLLAATRRGVFKLALQNEVRRLPLAFAESLEGALLLHNPRSAPTAGMLRLFDEQGQPFGEQLVEVPPSGLSRVDIPSAASSGWAEVEPLDRESAVEAVELLNDAQGVGALSAAPLAQRFTLPVINRPDGKAATFDTWLAVANNGDLPQRVRLELRDPSAQALAECELDLAPLGHRLVRISSLDWQFLAQPPIGLKGFVGLVEGEASGTVVVGGLLRKGNRFSYLKAAVAPSAQSFRRTLDDPQQELLFPQFGHGERDGANLQARLVLYNPGPVPLQAQIEFYDDQGAPLATPLNEFSPSGAVGAAIPARSLTVLESDLARGLDFGWLRIESNLPLDGWLLLSGNLGTAILDGAPSATSNIALPIVNTAAPPSITGFTLANPGGETAQVQLGLRDSDGRSIAAAQLELPPLGHLSRFLSEIDWTESPGVVLALDEFEGLLFIESPTPLSAALLQFGPGRFALLPVGQ